MFIQQRLRRERGHTGARLVLHYDVQTNSFSGFLERFGATECHTLTRCDHSIPEEVERFYRDEVYRDSCLPQLEYVLSYYLEQLDQITGE